MRKIHLKESIVEFRILTKKGEKGQTANLRTVQAKRADRALERESSRQHSPPCSTTSCENENKLFA